jgi:hypothetical protein
MSHSRYFESRVQPHFTRLYSKVPYLDTEIFNIGSDSLRESRKIAVRTNRASDGLARTLNKSVMLESELARSRCQRERDDSEYLTKLSISKTASVNKGADDWREYLSKKSDNELRETREQRYLQSRLLDNSRRAYQRLDTVRRWL